MIRADLHVHTRYSPDATNQPRSIVEKLNAHPKIKVVAITDHNTIEGYSEMQKLASAYEDVLVVPGVEIGAIEGEIIVLGITELPPKPWKAKNIIAFAVANDGLTIAPHPYRGLGLGDLVRQLDVDAVEVLNGITPSNLNKQAEELAKARGLPGVAGSDSHFDSDPWNVCTEVKASLDIDEILEAIKKGLVKVSSTGKSIHF
jgi:hypothetical protein